MSKSLQKKVLEEIKRREDEKLAEVNAKKEEIKKSLLGALQGNFDTLLRTYQSFEFMCFEVPDGDQMLYNSVISEIGFQIMRTTFIPGKCDQFSYKLSIPDHEKGQKRTPAQLALKTFNKNLSEARNRKKADLRSVCDDVKAHISKLEFNYSHLGTDHIKIFVLSSSAVSFGFEEDYVERYFKKFHFTFLNSFIENDQIMWSFLINR